MSYWHQLPDDSDDDDNWFPFNSPEIGVVAVLCVLALIWFSLG